MAIKLSSLKKRDIRRKIFFVDELGEHQEIIIRNPNEEEKKTIIDILGGNLENDVAITAEEIITKLIPLLTNIEIDIEDINLIVNNPSNQLMEVHYHLGEIVQELVNEYLMLRSAELSTVAQAEIISDIENKVIKINQEIPKKGNHNKN